MADGGGDTGASSVVERHDTAVGERKLQGTLCLLVRHFSRDRAVHFVRQPVFTCHGFHLQHLVEVSVELCRIIVYVCIAAFDSLVHHHRLGRVAEHLCHIKVERTHAVGLFKGKMRIAGGFAHYVHWCTFALGNAAHMVEVFLFDEEAHAFLTLVGNDFFGREGGVADGELCHIDDPAALLDQLGKTVDVSRTAVVVDGNHGIDFFFAEGTHQVVGTFLHFGVGTLHGIQFNARSVATGVYTRHRTAAQSDAVVVATHHNDFVAFFRCAFQAVALCAVAYAAGQHNHFVVGVLLTIFFMFEGEHGACDEGLTELVAEVGSTVGGFGEDLSRCLVEPFTCRHLVFPRTASFKAGIGRHVHCRSGDGPTSDTAPHTVADFTSRTGRCSIERLDGGREIVGFGFEGNDAFDVANHEVIAGGVFFRSKLFYHRTC